MARRRNLIGEIFDTVLEDIAADFGVFTVDSVTIESDRTSRPSAPQSVRITTDADVAYTEIEVPGFKKTDLTVEVEGKVITVSGTKGAGKRTFCKTFNVSPAFDVDSLKVGYDSGLLTLTLKRVSISEASEKRVVDIQFKSSQGETE